MAFSVRTTVPGHNVSDDDLEIKKQGLSDLYAKIDFMVHLCHHWNYEKVYGNLSKTIGRMIGRLGDDKLPQHLKHKVPDAKCKKFVKLLEDMKEIVDGVDADIKNGHPPQELVNYENDQGYLEKEITEVTLQSFFEIQFQQSDMKDIAKLWGKIFDELPNCLCLPWVQIQRTGDVVSRKDMEDHIAYMKQDELEDFFTVKIDHLNHRNKRLRDGILHGRKKKILGRSKREDALVVLGGGGPIDDGDSNGKQCSNGNGCVDHDGSFCNEDENGNCTIANGDPPPPASASK